jgi:hypothetical protein
MGYFSGYESKQAVIDYLNTALSDRWQLCRSTVVGAQQYQLIETKNEAERVCMILVNRISSYKGDWGYKPMSCEMQPYYYDAPLSYVKYVEAHTQQISPSSQAWYDKVKAKHQEAKQRKQSLQTGAVVELYGEQYRLSANHGRKGWSVTRVSDNAQFRMTARQVKQAKLVPEPTSLG